MPGKPGKRRALAPSTSPGVDGKCAQSEKKKVACPHCHGLFSGPGLRYHAKHAVCTRAATEAAAEKRSPVVKRGFKCDQCGGDFTKQGLRYHTEQLVCAHIKPAHIVKRFTCGLCGASLTQKGLKYHTDHNVCAGGLNKSAGRAASGQSRPTKKGHICEFCNASFTKQGLQYHNTHAVCQEKKPCLLPPTTFACTHCTARFSRQGLRYHLQHRVCRSHVAASRAGARPLKRKSGAGASATSAAPGAGAGAGAGAPRATLRDAGGSGGSDLPTVDRIVCWRHREGRPELLVRWAGRADTWQWACDVVAFAPYKLRRFMEQTAAADGPAGACGVESSCESSRDQGGALAEGNVGHKRVVECRHLHGSPPELKVQWAGHEPAREDTWEEACTLLGSADAAVQQYLCGKEVIGPGRRVAVYID